MSALPFAAACSDSDNSGSDAPSEAQYDDTAQAVGNQTANNGGEVNAMGNAVIIAQGALPLGFTLGANGSVNGSSFGLNYDFSLTCKDAAGTSQSACNSSTDSANASVSWDGTLDLPIVYAQVARDGDWSISGLQSDTATFDGSGSLTFQTTTANADYQFAWDASYEGVLVDTASYDAVGGSVTYSIDAQATRNGETKSFSMDASVEFTASNTAHLTLDGREYDINVDTGATVRVSN